MRVEKTKTLFPEIGQRLRAYRLGSGASADEIARRMGISRAALYRYEAGDIVKIETLARLAKLFAIPLSAILGMGIEYITNGIAFFERLRQLEEDAEYELVVFGPIAYVLTSDEYDSVLARVFAERAPAENAQLRVDSESLMRILKQRKDSFRRGRRSLVSLIPERELELFMSTGLHSAADPDRETLESRRGHAVREVEHIAGMFERPPMGVQIGLTFARVPMTGFQILRRRPRSVVAISPFRLGYQPNIDIGVATISDADEVIQIHQQIAERLWADALTGQEAAAHLRGLIARRGGGRRAAKGSDRRRAAAT